MEALDFLKEAKRKCSSTACEVCQNENYAVLCPISEYPDEKLEELVSGIEQWSKEHPIITNAQKFKEVFGLEPKSDRCPPFATNDYCTGRKCIDCMSWWDEPYKEPEHD